MLFTEKPPEIFPKHKGYILISKSFALNWYLLVALTNKKMLLPLQDRLKQNFIFDLEKLIEYWASAVNLVSSNPCVGPLLRIQKTSSFLLSICTDELILTQKIMTFLPTLPSINKNSERKLNPTW